MSEQNKQLVREFWGTLATGDFERLASLYDENVLYHGSGGEERIGRQAAVDLARMYKNAFPDMKIDVEQLVAEGNYVVSRVRPSGTHQGELQGMAPTGNTIDLKWVINMVRIENGRVVEEWEVFDQMDFMKQLGMTG